MANPLFSHFVSLPVPRLSAADVCDAEYLQANRSFWPSLGRESAACAVRAPAVVSQEWATPLPLKDYYAYRTARGCWRAHVRRGSLPVSMLPMVAGHLIGYGA